MTGILEAQVLAAVAGGETFADAGQHETVPAGGDRERRTPHRARVDANQPECDLGSGPAALGNPAREEVLPLGGGAAVEDQRIELTRSRPRAEEGNGEGGIRTRDGV